MQATRRTLQHLTIHLFVAGVKANGDLDLVRTNYTRWKTHNM